MEDGDEVVFGYDPLDPDSWAALPTTNFTGLVLLTAVFLLAGACRGLSQEGFRATIFMTAGK